MIDEINNAISDQSITPVNKVFDKPDIGLVEGQR